MRKIIILLAILIVVFSAVGFWYYQRNGFTKGIMKLEILGSDSINMGDEIEYLVKYKNTGQITLEDAKLIFEYPENAVPSDGGNIRVEKKLNDIYPGQEQTVFFRARILGQENEIKTAKANLNFKPKNLKAYFDSSTTLNSRIKSVPLTLEFDLNSKVEGGRELKYSVNYFSNCDLPLSNLEIKAEYPSGFEFIESKPKGTDKNEWPVAVLNKTEGGRIEISGRLMGETYEQKSFKVKLGIWKGDQFIILKETEKQVEIIKPSIYISSQINGSQNYVASLGDLLYYEIFYKNIGDGPFENLFLVAQLGGDAFDLSTVRASSGEYRQGENTILWDSRIMPTLRFLDPGEEGKVEFWVKLKDNLPNDSRNRNLSVNVQVTLGQIRENFATKINAEPQIIQKGLYNNTVFQNSGPLPPKVGETTTYNISWKISNFYNDLRNVKVKAALPQQVKLTGKIEPSDARLTFDQNSREIIWEVGDLNLGTDSSIQGPELNFQISLIPESYQKGQVANLISDAKIIGEDVWTDTEVQAVAPSLNTNLPDDPTITEQQRIVQ